MTSRTRRRLLLAAGVCLLTAAGYATGTGVWMRYCGPEVVNRTLVGRPEARIADDYGPPVREMAGCEPLGLEEPRRKPPGPLRTVVYHPRGLFHLEGSTMWVWYCQGEGGEWVCYDSCWFAADIPLHGA